MRRTLTVTLSALAALALVSAPSPSPGADDARPIKLLIITGDNVGAHKWKETTALLKDFLSEGGRIKVDVTATPGKDLTDENLARYDALLLNYRETPQGAADTKWSDANKEAFLKAVHEGGKGLVVYHYSSAAFAKPNWEEFERAVAGGWRTQGYHGPAHEFTVKKTDARHPISEGLPSEFRHVTDELYSNSMLTTGSVVLATAFSDKAKPKGTGKDEPVVWINHYGKGRVYENVLGHDVKATSDKPVQDWIRRGVEWAATGQVDSKKTGSTGDRDPEPFPAGRPCRERLFFTSRGVEMPPTGQHDYSGVRLTRHALDRFVERFGAEPAGAEGSLRAALVRSRRLGRNPENGAIAVLAVYRNRALVAVLQGAACLTVLTWNQFTPRLPEFGRPGIPRKWGRFLRRLTETETDPTESL